MNTDYSKKWLAFIGIALVTFACYLDYTAVNIALPTIQRELNVNITTFMVGMGFSFVGGLLQIFFSHFMPLWYIVIAFIFLGGMWAIGNTTSIIAGQSAVSSDREFCRTS